jgi:3-hydroxyacyl-CoA dehydrogenase
MGQFEQVVAMFRAQEANARKLLEQIQKGTRFGVNNGIGWIDVTEQKKKEAEINIATYQARAAEWSLK